MTVDHTLGHRMTADSSTSRRTAVIARLAAIGLLCLVAGFLVGWFTRGDGGDASVLPAATAPAADGGQGAPVTTRAGSPPAPAALPKPAQIRLAVLNGTGITGFAARTATRAKAAGYPDPSAGNAPTGTGPTVVYFRPGQRDAARRVAQDLGFSSISALPTTGPVATAAPAAAQVVVVLGPG